MEIIYRRTTQVVPAVRFPIALYHEENNQITIPFSIAEGERTAPQTHSVERIFMEQLIHDRESRIVSIPNPDFDADGATEGITAASLGAWLGTPMIAGDKVVGAIAAQTPETSQSANKQDLELLSTIAAQAATAFQNAHLYAEIRRLNTRLEQRVQDRTEEFAETNAQLVLEKERAEVLYRITRELSTSLDLDRVLNRALDLVSQAIGASQGAILMVDPQTHQLHYRLFLGHEGPLSDAERTEEIPPTSGVIGWVMENRQPLILADVEQDQRWGASSLACSDPRALASRGAAHAG